MFIIHLLLWFVVIVVVVAAAAVVVVVAIGGGEGMLYEKLSSRGKQIAITMTLTIVLILP